MQVFGSRGGAIVAINANSSMKESLVVLPEPQHLHGHHRLIPKETNAGTAGALGKVGRTPRVQDDRSLQSQDPQIIKASLTLPEPVQLLYVWSRRCWLQCLRHVLHAHPFVFNPRVDITKVTAQGDLWPLNINLGDTKKTYPCDYPFKFDQDDANDAALAAKMLSGAVKSELTGVHVGCDFKCDTDFGCDLCIPKGIVGRTCPIGRAGWWRTCWTHWLDCWYG